MTHPDSPHAAATSPPAGGILGWYARTPLYLRIVAALVVGILIGWAVSYGGRAAGWDDARLQYFFDRGFKPVSAIILRLLGALATPLIFIAVVNALVKARVSGRAGVRMTYLLMFNTVVAILVGLLVANVLAPGRHAQNLLPPGEEAAPKQKPYDLVDDLLGKLPGSVLKPLAENDILGVIVIALAVGIGLRVVRGQYERAGLAGFEPLEQLLEIAFRLVMVVLHWIIALVPLAVLAVVARLVGTQGIAAFQPMLWFIVAVLVALAIQAVYYLVRLRLGSWVRPLDFLRGGSDALLMAFSTASSAATMPVTYACMKEKVGIREESASLAVLVGGTFNHDGTALYEAMAALFISQVIGQTLGFEQQLVVVLMSVVASVGAAGIPEAGLVTMLAVFSAVQLPVEYIPLLLTVDWFLDRCRTAINVMGDMCVACLLDGKKRTETP